MDTAAVYQTFTHPRVVTSMLLVGIGLGLALSFLMHIFAGAWFLPVVFAAVVLGAVIVYMTWLDRQVFQEPGEIPVQVPVTGNASVLIRAECPPYPKESKSRYALFTDSRVIRSMLLLSVGLGLTLCIVIVLFRGTWFLPALIAALTIGSVVAFLCWLDRLGPAGS